MYSCKTSIMITLSSFENYALPQIWERGISYYRQGAVRNLEEDSPEEWVATVLGTEDYTVEVTLEDDKVMDYICDCPYEGDMCKHVVATLLTIRERKKTEKYFIQVEETDSKSSGFSSETVKAEIDEILAIADKKQLMSFLSEYAVHHVDFRNALKQQFIPDRNTESLDTDYCQEVERCFLSSPSGSGYGRSGRRYSYEVDLNEISRKLSVYEKKAEFLMKQKSFGDAASIFLQMLRSIGKHYKEDSYYASYDNYFALSGDCYMAGEGLMSLGNSQEVPQSLKDDILKSLDEICDLSAYTEYCIYEIGELRDEFEMNALPLTKVLERVEKGLAGLDESDAGYSPCHKYR